MNNLHRELTPRGKKWSRKRGALSGAMWPAAGSSTFPSRVASSYPRSPGHLDAVDPPAEGVVAHTRRSQPIVQLRVPFTVDRQQVDDVAYGSKDADWQPVKDAARQIAFAEDRAVFEGYSAAGIAGIRASSSNPPVSLPAEVRDYPHA